ncbi:hypothetical protein [Azohydromonas aeria]|uniref:hypothetical protein n=1 Tax=Azohydromonas aeria TaxID=2590212 RepID=UPI0012F8E4C4|nr:hypothetical protein [Azohydromonas aeria]
MSTPSARDQGPLSMLFEMSRQDNPRLYDDLIRFNKGPKRVNRLRFLAHEGLMAQGWALVPAAAPTAPVPIAPALPSAPRTDLGDPAVTNALFSPPLPE